MAYEEAGDATFRAEYYDNAIKQMAEYSYKWKQLVTTTTTSALKNYFFRETPTIPSDQAGNAIKGIPRGADFPNAVVSWEKVQSVIEKYGLKGSIDYEDILMNNIDMKNRTLLRIAEGVTKAVDTEISVVLTENWTPSSTLTGTVTAGYWNETSGAVIKDLGTFKSQVKAYYDQASNFVLVINPSAEPHLLHYIYEKGAQAREAGQAAFNGEIGNPAGVSIITSSVVPASYAALIVPKTVGSWKAVIPLSTDTESKKFMGDTITACEMGVTELHNPKQVVVARILL